MTEVVKKQYILIAIRMNYPLYLYWSALSSFAVKYHHMSLLAPKPCHYITHLRPNLHPSPGSSGTSTKSETLRSSADIGADTDSSVTTRADDSYSADETPDSYNVSRGIAKEGKSQIHFVAVKVVHFRSYFGDRASAKVVVIILST